MGLTKTGKILTLQQQTRVGIHYGTVELQVLFHIRQLKTSLLHSNLMVPMFPLTQ